MSLVTPHTGGGWVPLLQASPEAIQFYSDLLNRHPDPNSLVRCTCCGMYARARYEEAVVELAIAGVRVDDPSGVPRAASHSLWDRTLREWR